MNTTNLFYDGKIDVSININGQIFKLNFHNSGTNLLKNLFSRMLVDATSITSADTPTYIDIWSTSAQSPTEVRYTTEPIMLSGKQLVDEVDNLYTAVTFTAFLSYNHVVSTVDPSSSDIYTMYLLSGNKERLASFGLSPQILAYISPGITATVNWTMRLLNKDDEV